MSVGWGESHVVGQLLVVLGVDVVKDTAAHHVNLQRHVYLLHPANVTTRNNRAERTGLRHNTDHHFVMPLKTNRIKFPPSVLLCFYGKKTSFAASI